MLRAQQHQVVDARLATIGPVLDMVAVQETAIIAARECAATVVPGPNCPLDGRRHSSCLAADREQSPVSSSVITTALLSQHSRFTDSIGTAERPSSPASADWSTWIVTR